MNEGREKREEKRVEKGEKEREEEKSERGGKKELGERSKGKGTERKLTHNPPLPHRHTLTDGHE
jgi:hypothetical protein